MLLALASNAVLKIGDRGAVWDDRVSLRVTAAFAMWAAVGAAVWFFVAKI